MGAAGDELWSSVRAGCALSQTYHSSLGLMLLSYFLSPPKKRISAVNMTAFSVLSTGDRMGAWQSPCFQCSGGIILKSLPPSALSHPIAHTYLTLVKSTSVVLKCPQDGVCLLPLRTQSAGPVSSKITSPWPCPPQIPGLPVSTYLSSQNSPDLQIPHATPSAIKILPYSEQTPKSVPSC